jgi:hypothetical protein
MLMRLPLLGGFIIMPLIGRCGKLAGDVGGELAMALLIFVVATKWLLISDKAKFDERGRNEVCRTNPNDQEGCICRV